MVESKKVKSPQVKEKSDENMWRALSHVSALAGFLIPVGNIIAPLLIYLLKKDDYETVGEHAKESLNFQISMTIYFFAAILLVILAVGIPFILLIPAFDLIIVIIATIKASEGEDYKYPLNLRLIK